VEQKKNSQYTNEIIKIHIRINPHDILMVSVCSCTTTTPPKEVPEPEPSYALQPGKDGAFADLEAAFSEKH